MIRAEDIRIGDVLRSLDPRDDGRLVRVVRVDENRVEVRRGEDGRGRLSTLAAPLRRWEFR
jgi:hypothetical protein